MQLCINLNALFLMFVVEQSDPETKFRVFIFVYWSNKAILKRSFEDLALSTGKRFISPDFDKILGTTHKTDAFWPLDEAVRGTLAAI